jgi:C4-dicarboxylate transporter DctM subunit
MSPVAIGIIGFIVLFAILALGLPLGVGMFLVGFSGLWYLISQGAAIAKIGLIPFETIASFELAVLPLFLLMAQVVFAAGLSRDLYNVAAKWLGHQRGGVAVATVGGCAGFAAVSASSLATAVTMGLVAIPEMKRLKYDPALSTGCVAAGGTIGQLIPPSAGLITYGIITQTSIGKLFMAGMVPGILEAIFYIVTIYILCTWRPSLGPPGPRYSFREKVGVFRSCGEIIGLIILVLGGLIIGWFTPTEAGAVGAFGAISFSLIRRRLNWEKFKHALLETMKTTGMLYGILIGAFLFKYFLAVTTIPVGLANFICHDGVCIPWLCYGCVGNDFAYHTHLLSPSHEPGLRPNMVWSNTSKNDGDRPHYPTNRYECICNCRDSAGCGGNHHIQRYNTIPDSRCISRGALVVCSRSCAVFAKRYGIISTSRRCWSPVRRISCLLPSLPFLLVC